MKDYSQNGEQKFILDWFHNKPSGNVLDIGANDGMTFSNSLALIESGWGGYLFEPSEIAFKLLKLLHMGRTNVHCLNYGIGNDNGTFDYYDSGEHVGHGDSSLISTFKIEELKRWEGSKFYNFEKKTAELKTFLRFQHENPEATKFKFITIDIEGLDFDVLTQIDLTDVGCEMLIIETNGKDNFKYIEYCSSHMMTLVYKNHENLIFVKQ